MVNRFANTRHAGRICHRKIGARLQRHFRNDFDFAAEMHQKSAVRNIDDFHAVNVADGGDDFLIVLFAGGIDGDVAHQKILADRNDINRFDVAARLSDGGRDFAQFSGQILNFYAQRNAVTRVRCLFITHNL